MAVSGELANYVFIPCRRLRTPVFRAAIVCVSVLAVYQIFFGAGATNFGAKPSATTELPVSAMPTYRRHTNTLIARNFSHLVGLVWPRANETFDRIRNQIDAIHGYSNATSDRKRRTKTILRVGDFNWYTWEPGQTWFKSCPVNECSLTKDKHAASKTADALLITELGYSELQSVYLPKPRHQIWITQHWESPVHDRIDTAAVKDLINWTVSYRRDSTIPISYSRFYPIVGASTPASNATTKNYAAGKTRKVAWFVSNCHAKNHRLRYAKELSKHIQVDIYGSCGRMQCPRSDDRKCLQRLSTDYKFYLSFENSNCDDYISEKLSYVALSHAVIPIVMGARQEDYTSFAPTHSYIHVDDFTDPQQLADYLHLLDRNDTLYNEYFTWKGSWMNIDQSYWCRLCALLHWRDDVDYVSWYDDYRAWWNGACDRSPTLPWFQRNSSDILMAISALHPLLIFVISCSVCFLTEIVRHS